jgi:hypothetical protein
MSHWTEVMSNKLVTMKATIITDPSGYLSSVIMKDSREGKIEKGQLLEKVGI